MRRNQVMRTGSRALIGVRRSLSSIVWLTALAASGAYAQSPTASLPPALTQLVQQSGPKAVGAMQNPATPTAKPSAFTYDDLGATPSIRLPRARVDKPVVEQSKPANESPTDKVAQQGAAKAAPKASAN